MIYLKTISTINLTLLMILEFLSNTTSQPMMNQFFHELEQYCIVWTVTNDFVLEEDWLYAHTYISIFSPMQIILQINNCILQL